MADGRVARFEVPDGTTPEQAHSMMEDHFSGASKKSGSDAIPLPAGARERIAATPAQVQQPDNLFGKAFGLVEPAIAMGTGAIGGVVGGIAGVGKSIIGGKFGTQAGVREGDQLAGQVADSMTYQPRTQTGNKLMQVAGNALHNSGIVGVPIPELNALARGASGSVNSLRTLAGPGADAMAVQDAAAAAGGGRLRDLMRAPTSTMPGVGSAATGEATLRAQRFANMRAPMKPTKGILTRSIDDVQFEREAAKRVEGKGLDNRFAELNQGMSQHLDALVDETGAQASSLRAIGKSVTTAAELKKGAKKSGVRAAYSEAEASAEGSAPANYGALNNFLEKHAAEADTGNAPVLNAIRISLKKLDPEGRGTIPLRDYNEIREMVGRVSQEGSQNAPYRKPLQSIIDSAVEENGGPLYRQARRMHENYSNEFTNRDVMDKLLRNKPGTKDRAVAYEDVADHILMNGSLDDMKHAFRVLEAHPVGTAPEIVSAGQQAARELRGAAAAKLKEKMFSNAGADSAGRVVGSEAQIKRIVGELDKDGKLEYLFGKKGAQEIRDTVEVATDLYSQPKGTVNTSNTASAMEKVLDRMSGTFGGTPMVGSAIKYVAKKVESRNYSKRVDASLNPLADPVDPPPTVRNRMWLH